MTLRELQSDRLKYEIVGCFEGLQNYRRTSAFTMTQSLMGAGALEAFAFAFGAGLEELEELSSLSLLEVEAWRGAQNYGEAQEKNRNMRRRTLLLCEQKEVCCTPGVSKTLAESGWWFAALMLLKHEPC